MRTSIRFMIVMLALALSLFTLSASAQTTTTGSVEGTVTDVNGAAVPGVTVTVSGPNLLHPQSGTTNSEGLYHIQNIPPGIYTVVVESAKGFAKFEQADVGWLKDLARDGHPIGNHTYDHVNVLAKKPEEIQFRFQRSPWLIEGRTPEKVIVENIRLTSAALKTRNRVSPFSAEA